jgi:hypothetical protein
MFWKQKETNKPHPQEEFRIRVASAISDAIGARCDRRRLADYLESQAQSLRISDACLRPL